MPLNPNQPIYFYKFILNCCLFNTNFSLVDVFMFHPIWMYLCRMWIISFYVQ